MEKIFSIDHVLNKEEEALTEWYATGMYCLSRVITEEDVFFGDSWWDFEAALAAVKDPIALNDLMHSVHLTNPEIRGLAIVEIGRYTGLEFQIEFLDDPDEETMALYDEAICSDDVATHWGRAWAYDHEAQAQGHKNPVTCYVCCAHRAALKPAYQRVVALTRQKNDRVYIEGGDN